MVSEANEPGARAASAATTDEVRRAGRAPGVGRRRREERAAIWQRGCRRAPPDRSPQPPWLLGQPPTTSEAVARLEHHLVVVAELPQDRGARAADREVAQAEPQVVAYEVGRAREHGPRLALDRVRAFHLELEALGEQLLAERPGEAGLGVVDQAARRAGEDGDLVELHERREAVDQVVRADPPLDGVEGREEVAERDRKSTRLNSSH